MLISKNESALHSHHQRPAPRANVARACLDEKVVVVVDTSMHRGLLCCCGDGCFSLDDRRERQQDYHCGAHDFVSVGVCHGLWSWVVMVELPASSPSFILARACLPPVPSSYTFNLKSDH